MGTFRIKGQYDPIIPRLERLTEVDANGCWVWQGGKAGKGYGSLVFMGKRVYAHRLAYELLVGPIPEGLTIDHLCKNPPCINPEHLEPVTLAVNLARGGNAAKTHCKRGHEFTPENTFVRNGARQCRTCVNARQRAHYRANPELERERMRQRYQRLVTG